MENNANEVSDNEIKENIQQRVINNNPNKNVLGYSEKTQDIISSLKKRNKHEEFLFPSRNKLYTEFGLEIDKPIHVKPMTIEEEKILSTPRLMKSGQALDLIFKSCISEDIPPEKLLTVDRICLLYFIRGISYGSEYEVEIKCPSCEEKSKHTIDLNTLVVNSAEDDFTGLIKFTLPDSGYNIKYRMSTGEDERNTKNWQQMRVSAKYKDDTVVRQFVSLIVDFQGITNKIEIEQIVNNLGAKDFSALLSEFSTPPFGVETVISFGCGYCFNEWEGGLPLDANFFSPKTKK